MSELKEIANKLDILIRVTAANLTQDKTLKEQVRLLSGAGLPPKEIAAILGRTPNHVSVTIHTLAQDAKKGEQNDTN